MKRRLISVFIALSLALSCVMPVFASDNQDVQVESEYYAEVTNYTGNNISTYSPAAIALNNRIKDGEPGTLVSGVSQKVYVSEERNDDGYVIESHLMSEDEVNEYLSQTRAVIPPSGAEDSTTKGTLTLTLLVYDRGTGNYAVYGTADWVCNAYSQPGVNTPAPKDDYLAFNWGGDEAFTLSTKRISANYKIVESSATFSQCLTDPYSGICWSFLEYDGVYGIDTIDAFISLYTTDPTVGSNETDVKLTYIHSYNSFTGSVSFTVGTSGLAGGIVATPTTDSWQIQVAVPGLKY